MRVIIETRAVSPSSLSRLAQNSNGRGPAHSEIFHVVGDRPLAHCQRCGKALRGAHLRRSALLFVPALVGDT